MKYLQWHKPGSWGVGIWAGISIGLATSSLALGFILIGRGTGALLFSAFGGLWLAQQLSRSGGAFEQLPIASVGLIGFLAAAAGGVWMGMPPFLALLCVIAALSAWDLDYFIRRVRSAEKATRPRQAMVESGLLEMEQRHLRRLGLVVGLGLLVAGAALLVQIEIGFGMAFTLALLAILGLGQLVRVLLRNAER